MPGRPPAPDALVVLSGGPLTTVQDHGRPGHAHLGVPPSGALDRAAHDLANRLVGNPPGAATLETTLGGPRLLLAGSRWHHVALAGAPAAMTVDGRPVPLYSPVGLAPGSVLEVGAATAGVRSYLAFSGGVAADAVLGSRSHDVLGGLGPPPLAAGDRLELGDPCRPPAVDSAPPAKSGAPVLLAVVPGPHDDMLAGGITSLFEGSWTASASSNRVGLRLDGTRLLPGRGEVPPEGIVTGAVQVPPGGLPVVFLADHPVTGGYPVVAVVRAGSLAAAAQARPGDPVRFSA